jgi:hypothetical protein
MTGPNDMNRPKDQNMKGAGHRASNSSRTAFQFSDLLWEGMSFRRVL